MHTTTVITATINPTLTTTTTGERPFMAEMQ